MGDTVIITEDEAKPAKPDVVVVVAPEKKHETIVVEKTTVTETRVD